MKQAWTAHKLENDSIAEALPKDWEIWALGVLHREDEPPGHLALDVCSAYIERSRKLGEIQISLLKGVYKISHALEPRVEAVIWEKSG